MPLSCGRYGEHLSKEQVAELVAPSPDGLNLVSAWLEHHGVPPSTISTKHGGSWLILTGVPVSRANNLLEASYQLYQHIGTNMTVLRTLSYGLPEALISYVQTVAPSTHFGFPHTSWQKPRMRRDGDGAAATRSKVPVGELGTALSSRDQPARVTPDFLRWLYRTSAYVPTAARWNVVGIVGSLNDYPSPDDLRIFMNEYRSDAISATYTVVGVNGGGYNPNNPAYEPNLNIEYAEAMAFPATHIFYSIGINLGDPLITWLEYVLDRVTVPQTISSSYGSDEYAVPPDYAIHVCNLFAQLGARGASLLFASGDGGVGTGNCLLKDGFGNTFVRFLPTFPSTCPCVILILLANSSQALEKVTHNATHTFTGSWVTSVGGTTGYNPEVAASISGGGFSAYFPQPLYQSRAVPAFLQNLGGQYYGLYKCVPYCEQTRLALTCCDLYSPRGRGIPDISLQAMGFALVSKRQPWLMDGTSCAAPVRSFLPRLLSSLVLRPRAPCLLPTYRPQRASFPC